jgi:hypothetical protein
MHMKRRAVPSRCVHRAAGDLAGAEIAGLLQLGIVPDIDPAAAEDARHLLAQDVVGDEHLAVEQERLLLAVVDNVGAGGHLFALVGWALELRYRAPGKRVNLGRGWLRHPVRPLFGHSPFLAPLHFLAMPLKHG